MMVLINELRFNTYRLMKTFGLCPHHMVDGHGWLATMPSICCIISGVVAPKSSRFLLKTKPKAPGRLLSGVRVFRGLPWGVKGGLFPRSTPASNSSTLWIPGLGRPAGSCERLIALTGRRIHCPNVPGRRYVAPKVRVLNPMPVVALGTNRMESPRCGPC